MPKSSEYITKSYFDKVLSKLLATVALRKDLEILEVRFDRMESTLDTVVSTLDSYLKKTEVWHDEMAVLRMSHRRLKDVLVHKGVVSDSELAV